MISPSAAAAQAADPADPPAAPPSQTVIGFADWVTASGDNHSLPFVIIDKVQAEVFVFGADGRPGGAAPALMGLAAGDDATPGVGQRELSKIRPAERTTPAGRFIAAFGPGEAAQDTLWVDYDTAISLHAVIDTGPVDRRAQRLQSPTPHDNRITYGCINVPAAFYEDVVRPAFTGTDGIVYVLPETRSAEEVFPGFRAPDLLAPETEPAQIGAEPTSGEPGELGAPAADTPPEVAPCCGGAP